MILRCFGSYILIETDRAFYNKFYYKVLFRPLFIIKWDKVTFNSDNSKIKQNVNFNLIKPYSD